jgi:drug/metabolite transporter (DMT)-like permease
MRIQDLLRARRADVAMSLIILVWGTNYIVAKDALSHLPPLAFNAIRFALGLPVMVLAARRAPGGIRVAREDVLRLIGLGMLGPLGYQFFFILAIDRTTSTNTALLTSTAPMWTAIFSLLLGILVFRRPMLIGMVMSLLGVSLVVLGGSGSGFSLSHTALIGSGLALVAALVTALYNIQIKSLVDRYGSITVAVWVYAVTVIGLLIVAVPDLRTLSAENLPVRVWPNLFYSGVMSVGVGFLVESYAIKHIGPTRMSSYSNFTPIVAAVAGILVMGDSLTIALLIGGALTMTGVVLVRRNTYLRLPPTPPTSDPEPTAARVPGIRPAEGR